MVYNPDRFKSARSETRPLEPRQRRKTPTRTTKTTQNREKLLTQKNIRERQPSLSSQTRASPADSSQVLRRIAIKTKSACFFYASSLTTRSRKNATRGHVKHQKQNSRDSLTWNQIQYIEARATSQPGLQHRISAAAIPAVAFVVCLGLKIIAHVAWARYGPPMGP